MSNKIQGAHIFSAGTWNDRSFDEAALDGIVATFNQLAQSGRVPLKFGHDGDAPRQDGQPALGWVSRVWREGRKLLADFSDVPSEVYAAIKKGLYKFVSIELLKDAEHEGATLPYVLDAVALLGADPPAVRDLADLQRLAASRSVPSLKFDTRVAFTSKIAAVPKPADDELAALRAKIASLESDREIFRRDQTQAVLFAFKRDCEADIEAGIREGHYLPSIREAFKRLNNVMEPQQLMKFGRDGVRCLLGARNDAPTLTRIRSNAARADLDDGRVVTRMADGGGEPPDPVRTAITRINMAAAGDRSRVFDFFRPGAPLDPEMHAALSIAGAQYIEARDQMRGYNFAQRPTP